MHDDSFRFLFVYHCCHTISHIALCIIFDMKSYYQVGLTALHSAAQGGHIEVVRLLLDRNANIDAVTKVSHDVSIASR